MSDHPIFNLLAFAAGVYLFHLWWSDTRAKRHAVPTGMDRSHGTLPGTTSASALSCLLAAIGAIGIIAFVTLLEIHFEVQHAQSSISGWFLPAMLGAAVTEEIVFRGYLVVTHKGNRWLLASILFCSLLFALIHPYLWVQSSEDPGVWDWLTGWRLRWELQPVLATLSIFTLSLWFYAVRFWPLNPTRSLLPCFSAHASANLVVFIIKFVSGHIA